MTDTAGESWPGRFPKNEIISLLDVNRPFNLAESTARDLTLGEVLDLAGIDGLRELRLGYGSSAGLPALREAIGASCQVPASHVLTTQGAASGLFLLAFELCRPGDEVALVMPCFPPTRDALVACGVAINEVRLTFDEGYRIDVDRLAGALTARTRLVSLATPHNPSGVRVPHETLRDVLDAMAEHAPHALLVVDEVYRHAAYGTDPTPGSAAGLDPRVITIASISKAYGAPGLRVGWLTVPDDDLRERLAVAKLNTVISGSVLDEALASALLRNGDAVLGPRRRLLAQALDEVAGWQTRERQRLDWVPPDGGALCCMRLSPTVFDGDAMDRFWAALPQHDLQLASGSWFGETDRVFRLGFGYLGLDQLRRGLQVLSETMDALGVPA
jgi:aspartate/methionine/tyrosine aminotransferase